MRIIAIALAAACLGSAGPRLQAQGPNLAQGVLGQPGMLVVPNPVHAGKESKPCDEMLLKVEGDASVSVGLATLMSKGRVAKNLLESKPVKDEETASGFREGSVKGEDLKTLLGADQLLFFGDRTGAGPSQVKVTFSPMKDGKAAATPLVVTFYVGGSNYRNPGYRLWLYTGVTLAQSTDDFSKGYPVALIRFELNMTPRSSLCFLRASGEAGLTSTTVPTSTSTTTSTTTKSFDGMAGLGWGHTWDIGSWIKGLSTSSTFLISAQLFGEMGVTTVPADAATKTGGTSFGQTFLGLKIQNENGGYQGAYFAIGVGRSEQYRGASVPDPNSTVPYVLSSQEVTQRFKVDAFLPFYASGKYTGAFRLQVDQSRWPFAANLHRLPGNIRLSLLIRTDIRGWFNALWGGAGNGLPTS